MGVFFALFDQIRLCLVYELLHGVNIWMKTPAQEDDWCLHTHSLHFELCILRVQLRS